MTQKRQIAQFILLLPLVAALTLCGCGGDDKKDEKKSESGSPQAKAKTAAKDGKNDKDAKLTAAGNSKNGAQKDASAKKASSTPAIPFKIEDLGKPEGVEFVMSIADTSTVMYRGAVSLDSCAKFYDEFFTKKGWVKNEEESEVIEGTGFFKFEKGELAVSLTLNPDSGKDTLAIMIQGNGVTVPEEKEDE